MKLRDPEAEWQAELAELELKIKSSKADLQGLETRRQTVLAQVVGHRDAIAEAIRERAGAEQRKHREADRRQRELDAKLQPLDAFITARERELPEHQRTGNQAAVAMVTKQLTDAKRQRASIVAANSEANRLLKHSRIQG